MYQVNGGSSMRKLIRITGLVIVGLLLTGCGNQVDEEAWRADVESDIGHSISDWPTYRDAWVDNCGAGDSEFGLFVAASMDAGTSEGEARTNIRHACPDRLETLEDALAGMGDARSACDVAVSDRTEEQARLAEAMGC